MKLVPNAVLLYVADVKRSTGFYESLFDMTPVFASPAYVAYEIAPGVTFALWSRHDTQLVEDRLHTTELGLNIAQTPEKLDAMYEQWLNMGATSVDPHYNDVFGRTFVVADPDGNLIRVAPAD